MPRRKASTTAPEGRVEACGCTFDPLGEKWLAHAKDCTKRHRDSAGRVVWPKELAEPGPRRRKAR